MGSAACRGAGPERAMGPESVPLYCLAVMGANPARLWPLAWGTESRRRRGRTAVIDQGRWRRVRGMGSLRGSVWVRDFGQIPEGIEDPPLWACGQRGWSAFPGRPPAGLQARLSGRAAEEDDLPLWAGCLRGLLLVFLVRSPIGLKARLYGHVAKGDGSPFRAGCLRGLLLAYSVRWPKAGWLATQGRLPESGYSPPRSGNRKG